MQHETACLITTMHDMVHPKTNSLQPLLCLSINRN